MFSSRPQCLQILSEYLKRDVFTALTCTDLTSVKYVYFPSQVYFMPTCLQYFSSLCGSCLMICPREDMQRRKNISHLICPFLSDELLLLSFLPLPCCYSRPLYLGHCTHPWGWETDGNFPPFLPSVFPRSSSPLCLFLCLQRRRYRFISVEHHSLDFNACFVKCRWTF